MILVETTYLYAAKKKEKKTILSIVKNDSHITSGIRCTKSGKQRCEVTKKERKNKAI